MPRCPRSRRVLPEHIDFVRQRSRAIFGSQARLAKEVMVTRQTANRFLKGKPVDWDNCHDLCEALRVEDWIAITTSEPMEAQKSNHDEAHQRHHFGAAPDFQVKGHTKEKQQLKSYVIDPTCHLVSITGMAQIGKTFLVAEVMRQVAGQFDFVIWQRIRGDQEPKQLVAELLSLIDGSSYDETVSSDSYIERLIECFRRYRCLVVLNRVELVMQPGDGLGKFVEGYQGYGDFLIRVGNQGHQSCLLAISREPLNDLTTVFSDNLAVRQLSVGGLSTEDALTILHDRNLKGTPEKLHELVESYGKHPYFLRLAATYIKQLHQGDTASFLSDDNSPLVINGIRTKLDKVFDRLSKREQEVLSWIAIFQISCSEKTLSQFIKTFPANLKSTLLALRRRSLVANRNGKYHIHAYLREYLLTRIKEAVVHEIETRKLYIFNQYPLLLGEAEDYVYQKQQKLLLEPVFNLLKQNYGHGLYRCLEDLHKTVVKAQFRHQTGFAAANMAHLLKITAAASLIPGDKAILKDLDFSDLMLKQADFRDIKLQNVCFRGADLEQSVFYEPFGGILSVAVSQDGRFLAAGDASRSVYVWKIEGDTFKLHRKYSGHTHWVRTVAISPTGKYVAAGSEDNTVRIWNLESGETVQVLRGYGRRIRSLAFSPDEKYLSTSGDDSTVVLWNTKNWQRIGTHIGSLKERRFREVVFDALGQVLIAANQNGQVHFWDVNQDPELQFPKFIHCRGKLVRSIAIHPNGQIIASGSDDAVIRLHRFPSGELISELPSHSKSWIRKVIYSPDGKLVACSSEDGTVQVWDVDSCERVNFFNEHQGRVWEIAFTSDGQRIVSGSDDQQIKLWDLRSNRCVTTLKGHTCKLRAVAFSPDGKWLATAGDDQIIRLWDVEHSTCMNQLSGHTGRVWALSFYRDQSGKLYLISGSDDRTVKFWDLEGVKCAKTLDAHTSWVRTVAASPTNCLIFSGGDDKVIRAFHSNHESLPEIKDAWTFPELHNDWILSLAASPDGKYVVSGSDDGTAHLWDVETRKVIHTFKQHHSAIRAVAISPDGQWIATGSKDQTIRLFALNDPTHSEHPCSPFTSPEGHDGWVRCLAFHPTKPILASGAYDQKAILWNLENGQLLRVLRGHDEAVISVAFSPQGEVLATGSEDETIRMWNVETGRQRQSIRIPRPYEGLDITDAHLTSVQQRNLVALGAIQK